MAKATPLPEHATPVDPVLLRVLGLARPICEGRGLAIVSICWATEAGGRVMRITIEPAGAAAAPPPADGVDPSVSLDECAWVSRALSDVLDADEDIVPGAYSLEVGSPGIERELVSWADVRRFVGRSAKVKLFSPLPDGQRAFRGTFLRVSDDPEPIVEMLVDGKTQRFGIRTIASAHLVVELAALKSKKASKKAPIVGSQS